MEGGYVCYIRDNGEGEKQVKVYTINRSEAFCVVKVLQRSLIVCIELFEYIKEEKEEEEKKKKNFPQNKTRGDLVEVADADDLSNCFICATNNSLF